MPDAVKAADNIILSPGLSAGTMNIDGEYLLMSTADVSLTYASTTGGMEGMLPGNFSSFWIAAGMKRAEDDETVYGGYAEAGFWFLLNFGGGVTYLNIDDNRERGYHFFTGMPVLLSYLIQDLDGLPEKCFVEPYYRYTNFSGFSTHEFGLYFKIAAVSWTDL